MTTTDEDDDKPGGFRPFRPASGPPVSATPSLRPARPGATLAPSLRLAAIRAALAKPGLPLRIRRARTRLVNAHPAVVAARAAIDRLLSPVHDDVEAARAALERDLARRTPAEVAETAAMNPAAFGSWYGDRLPGAPRPELPALGAALADLARALEEARREAEKAVPADLHRPRRRPAP
jgi:hypothetical protein